jgi:hypothetical protein
MDVYFIFIAHKRGRDGERLIAGGVADGAVQRFVEDSVDGIVVEMGPFGQPAGYEGRILL